ncbi:hypothetical protein NDU88_002305 [Pleurodeles waltl]|uniref:Uncharacterized protein n=1 Tax=Pleurodeles waltl TaxID=8319 RepID=A0AAV7KV98_PLEWA|nr:hypothetical protein NDU88_002305 [Pleurodeles waltl]
MMLKGQLQAQQRQRPIGVSPHTTQTCAAAAPDTREPHEVGTNPKPRPAVTLCLESRNAGPEQEEKAASQGREVPNQETEENGVVGVQMDFIGQEDERSDGETEFVGPREAERETPPRFWRSVARPARKGREIQLIASEKGSYLHKRDALGHNSNETERIAVINDAKDLSKS